MIVIIRVPGRIVKDMLEVSVSSYPKLEGRFASISGLKFSFDPDLPPGSRVFNILDLNDKPFDFSRSYNIALKNFISIGRDGYECFKDKEVTYVRDAQNGLLLQDLMYNVFDLLKTNNNLTP